MSASVPLAAALGCALGSIPWGWLLVRWRTGGDLAQRGSGNVGALNAMRVSRSPGMGVAVLVLDLLKGLGSVLLVRALDGAPAAQLVAGVAAVAAHAYNPWLSLAQGHLRGGKGFATAAGALLLTAPLLVVVWLSVGLLSWLALKATKGIQDEAPSSALATLLLPGAAHALYGSAEVWATVALALLILPKLWRECRAVLRAPPASAPRAE